MDVTKAATFLSSSQLQVSATFGNDPSTWTAQVIDPSGATSGTASFAVNAPMPAITSLSPSSTRAGGAAFTLTVNGNTFSHGSVVRWNGSNRTTTLIISPSGQIVTGLQASISAADIASVGTAQVTVYSPGPGGGTSSAATFTISTIVDTTPPTPNPSQWATAPYATGTTSINMTAMTASDPSGVQYFFHCLTTGGHDSSWQASSTYQDTGLTPNATYTYQVKTRDLSPAYNQGSYSISASAKTQQVSGQAAALVSKSVADHTVKNDASSSGQTFVQTFTLRNTGTTPWVGCSLVHVAGSDLLGLGTSGCSPTSIPIPTTAAGDGDDPRDHEGR